MKQSILILVLMFGAIAYANAQDVNFNSSVTETGNLVCHIIIPLSVSPNSHDDFLNFPTVPVGSKYNLGTHDYEDSDKRSYFTYSGEAGSAIEISIDFETIQDNVEINFVLRGTSNPPLGTPLQSIPILNFSAGKEIVSLSTTGKYYLHIEYNWVWAYENAEPGYRRFVQKVSAQYYNI